MAIGSANDVWNSDIFSQVSMTDALITRPNVGSELEDFLDITPDTSLTEDFSFDIESGQIYLLGFTPRGAPLKRGAEVFRAAQKYPIARFGEEEELFNRAVLGVRETGSASARTLEGIRNKKLDLIQSRIKHTSNFLIAKSLTGKVVDPRSGAVVVDFHSPFGTTQKTITLDFSTDLKLKDIMISAKYVSEDVLGTSNMGSATAYDLLCGRRFWRGLVDNKEVKEANNFYSELRAVFGGSNGETLLRGDANVADGVMIGSVRAVNMGAARTRGGNGFVPDDEAYLVPRVRGLLNVVFGPSTSTDFWEQVLEAYVQQERMPYNEGIFIRAETYRTYYAKVPQSIIRFVGQNLPANPVIDFGLPPGASADWVQK